jgi:hypothetical protein
MSKPKPVMSPPHPEATPGFFASTRILIALTLASFLILALAFSFRQIDSPDIGLHLAPGKWILANLAFPSHEVFTYGGAHQSYVDTYWLYQVCMALLDRLAGPFLLVLANALFIAGSVYVLYRRSIAQPGTPVKLVLLALFFIIYTANFEIRPHVVSWIYIGLMLLVWERYVEDSRRSLLAVPLIMLLWVNTQPTFILGWIVTVSFWVSLTLREKQIDRKATMNAGLGILASFLNPYFIKGVALPFVQFGFLQQASVFKGLIAEYSPLPFLPGPEDFTYFGSLLLLRPMFILQLVRIAVTVGMLVQIARRRVLSHEALLFLLFFYLNSIAEKNVGYYLMAVTPFLMRSFAQGGLSRGERADRQQERRIPSVFLNVKRMLASEKAAILVFVCLIAVSLAMALRTVSNDFYSTQRLSHRFGFQYNNLFLPVKAAEFLNEHQLTGKIFNHIDFGGYLIDHVPQKVYIDARNEVMGEDLAKEYLQTYSPTGLQNLVDRYTPDIILFPHKDGASWLEFLQGDTARWRLVYFDELAAIYLRNGYAASLPAIQPDTLLAALGELSGPELNAILHRSFERGVLARFTQGQYFPVRESELSAFCSDNGWDHLALRYAVEAIRRSTISCPEIFYNMSIYFQNVGDKERAELCLKRASDL